MDVAEITMLAIGGATCLLLMMYSESGIVLCGVTTKSGSSVKTLILQDREPTASMAPATGEIAAQAMMDGEMAHEDWISQAAPRAKPMLSPDQKVTNLLLLEESDRAKYTAFKYKYLGAFLTAMFADWMKGAYIYALYSRHYNYDMTEIGQLFIAGFGSSLIFGTYVGSLTDRIGRKATCRLYCILYILACILKNWRDFRLLLLGRVLAGVSTSILYTGFESWAISEFNHLNLPYKLLRDLFQKATFYNALTAIVAGFTADFIARTWSLVAPFNAAIIPLSVSFLVIQLTWRENYGNQTATVNDNLHKAVEAMMRDKKILYTGMISGLFEGVMYVFVFMWTPALEESKADVSHGSVFAVFMVWKMAGSYVFTVATEVLKAHEFARVVFAIAAGTMLVPVFLTGVTEGSAYLLLFVAFCLYECCIGMYFPTISMMRSRFIDDDIRSTTMNLFRVPLNILVMLTLVKVGDMSQELVFLICAVGLLVSSYALEKVCAMYAAEGPSTDRSVHAN
ncbi:hypothetical protein SARC_01559 [Sphaeroforma arctica JP610]|uniref:Molybdate-anion transporter n=1 Tax=Sphaeroforma arctica JP610 TaxID=667725 RepID=A0A0L0GBA0_9EUKA|nr:hypothetical protein SARC_01559 [Sphaeroforma arctica JP610]KNC86297.1 hypothetical protein SARC_01559 [Sphaeroforma arctica JP610]|eukprot:XP_014160199.1 hypothetical protein SARC_01559 [Sphaeroforma arctica JP610]